MPEKPLSLLVIMFAFILLANCSNAVVVVKSGERIQAAIDAAHSGETIWPAVAVMSGFCFRCTATTQVSDNLYGCKLVGSPENRILGNTFSQNRFDAINLQETKKASIFHTLARVKMCSPRSQQSRQRLT